MFLLFLGQKSYTKITRLKNVDGLRLATPARRKKKKEDD